MLVLGQIKYQVLKVVDLMFVQMKRVLDVFRLVLVMFLLILDQVLCYQVLKAGKVLCHLAIILVPKEIILAYQLILHQVQST